MIAQHNALMVFADVIGRADTGPYRCPCCGFVTLAERAMYEICPVCFWEDDGQDDHDADECRGGPNGQLSLTEARRNFEATGASSGRLSPQVRAPRPEEHPDIAPHYGTGVLYGGTPSSDQS